MRRYSVNKVYIKVLCLLLKYTAVAGVYLTKTQSYKLVKFVNIYRELVERVIIRYCRASVMLLRYNSAHNYYNSLFIIHNCHTHSNDMIS